MSSDAVFAPEVAQEEESFMGEAHRLPALICFFGLLLHIFLPDVLLNSWGFNYGGEEGKFYEKIHPGSLVIFFAFLVLIYQHNPISQLIRFYRDMPVYMALLLLYILLFFYCSIINGFAGLALIPDTHMVLPICAVILAYAPISYCRRAIYALIAIAAVNSVIGIIESMGQFRIYTFKPDWLVLKEPYFRATALRGHPLNNSMFTAIALFTALAMRFSAPTKAMLTALFLASLVAFGGRIGLLYSAVGVGALGLWVLKDYLVHRNVTLLQMFVIATAAIMVPVCLAGGLYALIHSGVGERIASHMVWDKSADSRRVALSVIDYLTQREFWFGATAGRIVEIAYRVNLVMPLSDIENPWLLMFMFLGAIAYPLWLAGTMVFAWQLMRRQPMALKLAVLSYYIIASTSNSFGRKDSTYVLMVAAVICAGAVIARSVAPAREPDALPAGEIPLTA